MIEQKATVTVARLAEAKAIPVGTLIRFGLRDSADGVLFGYRNLDGTPARTRLRYGMRGAGGSRWLPGEEDIAPYVDVTMQRVAAERGYHILVEGESDCWAAWHHGFPAIGIPGPDRYSTITRDHLADVHTVYLQAEAENEVTYPNGVREYLAAVAAHVRSVGFTGELLLLRHVDGIDDLADLHQQRADRFAELLHVAFDQAEPIDLG